MSGAYKTSEETRMRQRQYAAERRRLLQERGFCPMCKKNRPFAGYKHCADCLYKLQMRNIKNHESGWREKWQLKDNELHKTRYAQRKAAGICTRCGARPARNGRTRCERCAYLDRVNANKYYHGKRLDDPGKPNSVRKAAAWKTGLPGADHPWRRLNRLIKKQGQEEVEL